MAACVADAAECPFEKGEWEGNRRLDFNGFNGHGPHKVTKGL